MTSRNKATDEPTARAKGPSEVRSGRRGRSTNSSSGARTPNAERFFASARPALKLGKRRAIELVEELVLERCGLRAALERGEKLRDRALGTDAPILEEHDAIAHRARFVSMMRHVDD